MQRHFLAASFAIVAFAGLASAPALADGLQYYATFTSASEKLVVVDYTTGTTTIGLVGIKLSTGAYSYSFDRNDLPALVALWNKAKTMDGTALVAAGSVAETGTKALDVLLLAGGPSARFSIADPVNGLVTFDLSRSDYPTFDAALRKAADALSS